MSEIEEISTLWLSRYLESCFECLDAEDAGFNDTFNCPNEYYWEWMCQKRLSAFSGNCSTSRFNQSVWEAELIFLLSTLLLFII